MERFVVEVFLRSPVYVTVEAVDSGHAEDIVADRLSDEGGPAYLAEIVSDYAEASLDEVGFELGTTLGVDA